MAHASSQPIFVSEHIENIDTLRLLTWTDLRELGMKVGDVRRLMVYLDMSEEVLALFFACYLVMHIKTELGAESFFYKPEMVMMTELQKGIEQTLPHNFF